MRLRKIKLFLIGTILLLCVTPYSHGQKPVSGFPSGFGRVFVFTAKELGIPILKASIKIENSSSSEQGKPLYQIQANIDSLPQIGFFFRMNNRFTSLMEAETFLPHRYVKEVRQEGLLIGKKNYLQTFIFDYLNKKVVSERSNQKEKQEISIPPDTCDPLSMFARCYLKEELHPEKDIRMSIYDGVKLRQMVFHPKKEKVKSKIYGEVETVCLESTTSFSTFGDKEGIIRIWYLTNGERTPMSIELELPIGTIKFDLESIHRS